MNEKIEITRRVAHGATPLLVRSYCGVPCVEDVYEYTLRYGDQQCRVVEDFHMQDMRLRMKPAEYNEYVANRLIDVMTGHIRDVIKQGVQKQAANNVPKQNNMAYLFGAK